MLSVANHWQWANDSLKTSQFIYSLDIVQFVLKLFTLQKVEVEFYLWKGLSA